MSRNGNSFSTIHESQVKTPEGATVLEATDGAKKCEDLLGRYLGGKMSI